MLKNFLRNLTYPRQDAVNAGFYVAMDTAKLGEEMVRTKFAQKIKTITPEEINAHISKYKTVEADAKPYLDELLVLYQNEFDRALANRQIKNDFISYFAEKYDWMDQKNLMKLYEITRSPQRR